MRGFSLPAPEKFTPEVFRTWARILREADRLSFKREQDIELGATTRLIVQSDDGTRYRIHVSNSGELQARAVVDGMAPGGPTPGGFSSGFDAGFG
jgi:hypothetical protein